MEDSLVDLAAVVRIRKVAASCPEVDNRLVVGRSYSLWSGDRNLAVSLQCTLVAEKY